MLMSVELERIRAKISANTIKVGAFTMFLNLTCIFGVKRGLKNFYTPKSFRRMKFCLLLLITALIFSAGYYSAPIFFYNPRIGLYWCYIFFYFCKMFSHFFHDFEPSKRDKQVKLSGHQHFIRDP